MPARPHDHDHNASTIHHVVSFDLKGLDPLLKAIASLVVTPIVTHLKRIETKMSALSDKIAQLDTTVADAEGRVSADLAEMKAKIAELQATIDAGGGTQADLDALDALTTRVKALDPHDATTTP